MNGNAITDSTGSIKYQGKKSKIEETTENNLITQKYNLNGEWGKIAKYYDNGPVQDIMNFYHPILLTKFQLIFTKTQPRKFNYPGGFRCTRNSFNGKELFIMDSRSILKRNINIPRIITKGNNDYYLSLIYRWIKYVKKGFSPISHLKYKRLILPLILHRSYIRVNNDLDSIYAPGKYKMKSYLIDLLIKNDIIIEISSHNTNYAASYVIRSHKLYLKPDSNIDFISEILI